MSKKIGRWLFFAGLSSFSILASIEQVQAESYQREYESNSGVGFYGEYIFPDEEKIQPPEVVPDGPIKEIPPQTENQTFPQTGNKSTELSSLGIVFLTGAYVIGKNKLKKEKEDE